ncbi:MAG: septal ring lytic transglycosylase RlpA family protein [Lysobacter sp.]
MKPLLAALLALGLSACASVPKQPQPPSLAAAAAGHGHATSPAPAGSMTSPYAPAQEDPSKRGHYQAGGLYAAHIADSTPDHVPDVDAIPEPEVTREARSRVGNRSTYTVLGQQYRVLDDASTYVEEGLASYYGNKFHGRRTSNLEVYDMYAFTAAHKTLPLPSFARVTNRDNGKSVVVRVNDRGPFHAGRVIDLSYAAAVKLGITQRGTGRVEVRALTPGEGTPSTFARATAPPPPAIAPVSVPASRLDRLVAAMPIASAAAGERPPGVRIATGKPVLSAGNAGVEGLTPARAAAMTPAPGTIAATVPSATTPASAASPPGNDYRFDMRQDGKAMSADEFEAWMKARQVRVATGKPGKLAVRGRAAGPAAAAAVTAPPPAPMQAAAAVAATLASASPTADVTLQVAAFSARGNADRALAMLRGAGIDGARLNDANANGQKVWRLRVGPLDAAHAPELAARIAGLGFGQPQSVRD